MRLFRNFCVTRVMENCIQFTIHLSKRILNMRKMDLIFEISL